MRKRQRQNNRIQCSDVNICITYVSLCFFWSVVRADPQFSNIIHIISIYIIPLKSESLIIFFLSGRQRTITRTCARRKRSTFQLPLEINNNIIFTSQLITKTTTSSSSLKLPWYIQYFFTLFLESICSMVCRFVRLSQCARNSFNVEHQQIVYENNVYLGTHL